VERFRSSGLSWPLGDDITDEELEERLYGSAGSKQGHRRHAEPDPSRAQAQARHGVEGHYSLGIEYLRRRI
jgi:transposase